MLNTQRALLTVVAACLASACTPAAPAPIPPPKAATIKSFTVTPAAPAKPGDTVKLEWTTENATSTSLEQLGVGPIAITATAATGTVDVVVKTDAIFVLTARGEGGTDSVTKSATLPKNTGGTILFDASPKKITAGQHTSLIWNASGATMVSIADGAGAMINLRGQVEAGSVDVSPTETTTYKLTAGSTQVEVTVTVDPVLYTFGFEGAAPLPGQMVKLSWTTSGGESVVLTRADLAAPLVTETDAAKVKSGSFLDVAPGLPVNGILDYTLTLKKGTTSLVRNLSLRLGGAVEIVAFNTPAFVRTAGLYPLSWKISGAETVELSLDGAVIYTAPTLAAAANGNLTLQLPANGVSSKLTLTARNSRGSVATVERTVALALALGTPATFTADKTSIAQGGLPVKLSWSIPNARHVRIFEAGIPVFEKTGLLDTGDFTVFPNSPQVVYALSADNGTSDPAATPTPITVTVTAPGTLTFNSRLPAGATAQVTGHNVSGGTALSGLPVVAKNAAGDAFIDITQTGEDLGNTATDTTAVLATIGPFNTRLFGRAVSGDTIDISPNGWFMFSPTVKSGVNSPVSPLGTQLEPLAIAPWYQDLVFVPGVSRLHWRVDTLSETQRRVIVQWTEWGNGPTATPGTSRLTFQAQVYSSGKVVFAYKKISAPAGVRLYGVVNGTETDTLAPTVEPVSGDVWTFFGPATPPVSFKTEDALYIASVKVPGGDALVTGSPSLPSGAVAITEINPRPAASVTNGEWIEITNFDSVPFDLNGWTIDFGGTANTYTFTAALPIPPGGRALLAQTANLGDSTAGLTADFVYPAARAMVDTAGSVRLLLGTTVYATINYDASSTGTAGTSVRIERPDPGNSLYPATLGVISCASTGAGTYGVQVGTPKAPNANCFPYAAPVRAPDAGFLSIATTGTAITLGDAGTTAIDSSVYAVALPTPVKLQGLTVSTLYVSTNGFLTPNVLTNTTTNAATTNLTTLSTTATVIGALAPFWDDLIGNPTGGMYWQQFDPDTLTTGDEFTLVSWEDWKVFATTPSSVSFQVRINANGDVEYHYGAMTTSTTSTTPKGSGATVWLAEKGNKAARVAGINTAFIEPFSGIRFSYAP